MKTFIKAKNFFQRLRNSAVENMGSRSALEQDSLFYWRVHILVSILLTSLLFCTFAVAAGIFLGITKHVWGLAIFDILAYFICIALLFLKGPNYRIRASAALLMFYLVGLVVIISVGPLSGGPAWLFAFAVLVGVLLGAKAAIGAVILNGLTLTIICWLMHTGRFGQTFPFFDTPQAMLSAAVNFFVLNILTAVSVSALVKGLVSSHHKEQALTGRLEQERGNLVTAKMSLEKEVEERRRAEEAVRESERKYRILAENINDMIWMMDILERRFTYVSPSVLKMRGYSPEEIESQALEEILTPDSCRRVTNILAEQIAHDAEMDPNRSVTMELEQYRKDGSTFWAETTASFIRNSENTPIAILGVTRDITERKQAEAALREKEEKLNRSKKMESLGLMAGGIAHDLNNILSSIVSLPDLLLMDCPSDHPFRKPLEIIRASGERAADTVSDLLTVARGVAVGKKVLNLNTIVKDYLGSPEQKKIAEMNPSVTFKTDLAPDPLNFRCSETHIRKILMNLVLNASEAIEKDGAVTLSTRNRYLDIPLKGYEEVRPGEYILLRVSDDGIGIPEEHLQRIFEPFYTKKMMGRAGTGLGLAVVWNTVQDHDGYIDVRRRAGVTEFEVFFPATRDDLFADQEQIPPAEYAGKGETILVIDDEENQRMIACTLLSGLGYEAESVSGGQKALEYLKAHQVDLIVLDMIMDPGMDGLDTFRKIVEIYPGQKAIIASGFSETNRVKEAQKIGAGQYLKKPYTLKKLGIAVREELKM
ncbi:MAG: PAS domain S-box protein [Deltaproteobacteria bacterium]|nr:PAS domain S-box protein [Deltaproteobacteria bacterium]